MPDVARFAGRVGHAVARRIRPVLADAEERRFDRRWRVATTGIVDPADLDLPGGGSVTGHAYTATPVPLLRWLLRAMARRPEFAPGRATFVDLGSGKGRVVLAAARFGYRAVGVEYAADLHAEATRNLAAAAERDPALAERVELVLGDAATAPLPDGPVVLYLNNPFPEPVMERVLAGVRSSLERAPRPLVVIYQQLREDDDPTRNLELIADSPLFRGAELRSRNPYTRMMTAPFLVMLFTGTVD